jgi:glycosyltransferase involved in cell wall biosynthesis
MKRILYVSDAQSIHTRRWAEHYRDCGVDVHIASFRPMQITGVTVHVLPTGGLGRLGYFLAIPALRRLVQSLKPDVIHAQYVTSYGFLSALAGLHPLVLTAWGTDVLISPRQSKLLQFLASYAVKHADAVTTVAQHMNSAVAELGVSLDVVIAVPFGVDTERFKPLPSGQRLNRKNLRLISTRNFAPIYNIETLIDAVAKCASRGLMLQVDLVGDGVLRSTLERQVKAVGLSDCFTFHGHVDHDKLSALLADADIFVTSALSDGNNVSLNEAMACACYPIATNIPANAQWIEDQKNGLLYTAGDSDALADCIEQACMNNEERQKAGLLNRQIVEQRADWRVCVDRMNDTYELAISKRKKLV